MVLPVRRCAAQPAWPWLHARRGGAIAGAAGQQRPVLRVERPNRGCNRTSRPLQGHDPLWAGRALRRQGAGDQRLLSRSRWVAPRVHFLRPGSKFMTSTHDPTVLPTDIPAPQDDGAARHLASLRLPSVPLAATDGSRVDLSKLKGRTVVYIYPRTGVPGQSPPDGWDAIPGARGCTPQSCSFRDHFAELKELGVAQLYGLSTQDSDYQREAVERLHLPFAVLSDQALELARAINLPTFTVAGMTLHKRMALVIEDGVIVKVFYPVFPPDKNAEEVVAWLRAPR